MKYCSNCGKELKDDDLFCSKCGTKQILERKCINCGIKLDEDAVFCPKCGTKQESETIVENSTSINNYPNRITKKEYNLNQGPIDLEMIQIPGTNFEMLETPVTQKLYETVTGENPSYFYGETNPVEMVNFFDAIIFCNLLSVINRKTPCYSINGDTDVQNWPFRLGDRKHFFNSIKVDFDTDGYRLPVEHEWVYAARGGQCFKHAGSDKLKPVAWYTSNSDSMTHPVKEKLENGYGLFDMNGNVWEWVQEYLWPGVFGGSWKDGKDAWSTGTSKGCNPNTVHNDVGFRIVSGDFYAKDNDRDIKDYEEISFEDLDNDFDDSDSYDEDSDDYEENSYNSENYDSDDYNSYESEKNYSNSTEKKEKIYQTVLNYASKIGEDCVGWKLWKYDNYPTKKKDLLLKFDSNFNYDDFACLFAIPNALKFQLSPKGDYGILFTLSGFYIKDPLMQTYFIKYSEITKCDIIKKHDIRIHLNHMVTAFISDETFVDNCEYSALPLANLLNELKSIDSDYPSDHLIATRSDRTVGIHSAHDRKVFLNGQKIGYNRCSREYEIKLRRQAELFLKTTNKWRRERDEYEALLDEYDATIVELEEKLSQAESPEYRQRLNNVSNYRDQLASLSY